MSLLISSLLHPIRDLVAVCHTKGRQNGKHSLPFFKHDAVAGRA